MGLSQWALTMAEWNEAGNVRILHLHSDSFTHIPLFIKSEIVEAHIILLPVTVLWFLTAELNHKAIWYADSSIDYSASLIACDLRLCNTTWVPITNRDNPSDTEQNAGAVTFDCTSDREASINQHLNGISTSLRSSYKPAWLSPTPKAPGPELQFCGWSSNRRAAAMDCIHGHLSNLLKEEPRLKSIAPLLFPFTCKDKISLLTCVHTIGFPHKKLNFFKINFLAT